MTTHTPSDTSLWVRRYHQAPGSRVRLICFPHAGGSASYFNPVSAALSPAVEVAAIQYPGRQDRRAEPCVGDLRELAALVWEQLRPVLAERPEVPTALFGHSMGSIVAFEVARLMEREPGTGPLVLFASGRRAPAIPHDDDISGRDEAGIVAEMRALGGTDSRVLADPELLEMVLPALRNDYRAVESYCSDADTRISAPVSVLVGDTDPRTSMEQAHAWSGHTSGTMEIHTYPGGHFYLEHNQAGVLGTIRDTLTKHGIRLAP
ncbi:Surfactin synthase thioesterase subunit [Streptomyces sp. yr375]|uniref:thioesterase II family protein n=1 Tax=Streptomyces sp. yr375 TaxID=1761906 RepID=UPI0008CDC62E|nr:alpha/beta fold hydrolase [Streptomyces sp. yr375]SES46678.1 Surfactin synthase thioesterase subunit [Streptomyces sp. yr375]